MGKDGWLTAWKTRAWETAFDQIREVSDREFAAVPIRTGHPQNEVRLIDVLLRPEVLVFEPLWTVIPGNKAILPILWSLFRTIVTCWIPISLLMMNW